MNNYVAKRSLMNALEIHVKLVKLLETSLCPTAKQVALKFTMYLVNKDFSLSHVQFFFFLHKPAMHPCSEECKQPPGLQ